MVGVWVRYMSGQGVQLGTGGRAECNWAATLMMLDYCEVDDQVVMNRSVTRT